MLFCGCLDLLSIVNYCFETDPFTASEAHHLARLASQLLESTCLHPTGLQACIVAPSISIYAKDPNSDPQACALETSIQLSP